MRKGSVETSTPSSSHGMREGRSGLVDGLTGRGLLREVCGPLIEISMARSANRGHRHAGLARACARPDVWAASLRGDHM
jgi:hypothetical protein